MGKVKFLREPGYIFDLFFLFTLKFNKEYCLTNFINYNKSSDDTDYYNRLLKDFPEISDELILFFYIKNNGKSLITEYYYEPYKVDFISGKYNLSIIQDALSDYEQVKENLIRFYFMDIDEVTLLECKSSILAVNKLIKDSDYSGDLKSALYSFFIEPSSIIRKLSYELMQKELILSQKYDENYKLLNELQQNFNFDILSDGLKNFNNQNGNIDCFDEVYITFCLYNKNCIKTLYFDNESIVILGFDYIDLIEYLIIQNRLPELETFGNAVSETNRIGILDLMLQKGEITIKDLEQEFGFTGTNAYYHLSLMIKAGMLRTRNKGRTVLYSINKSYFQVLCDLLGKYYKD